MALNQKLENAKSLLEEIQKVYDELGKTNPFQGMDPETVAASNKEIDKLEIALTGITKKANDLEKGFGGIAASIGASLAEMTEQSSATNRTVKAMRGLSSISESLKNDQSDLSKLSLKELESKRDKAKILSQEAKSQAALVKQKYDEITLDKNGNQLHGAALDARLKSLGISKSELQTINEIIAAEKEKFPVLDELNAKIEERIQKEKKVNKAMGLTKVALEGMGKIPIVGPLLDVNKALGAARKKAEAGKNDFQVMGAAMGSMGKSLATSLTSPLGVIGLIVKGFQMLLELGFATDKQVVALQKSLYLSRDGAEALRETFHSIAENNTVLVDGLNSAFVSVTNQNEAMMQLSDAMGGVSMATLKETQSQIQLTKQMGFTVEEGQALYVLGRQNKMTASEIVDEIGSQVKAYQKQSGVLLNTKKITSEVSTINGQLRLQYKNNVTQLTAAVIQSNKLGFSLKQSKDIAEGLLNFEQSIEDELSAELLLGRGLNLEQARLLALNGESAKATALIAENMEGSAGFSALNVVQQDALAKALNMTSDELANSMLYQENLAKLGEEEKQRVIEQIDLLESKGNIEAAQQLQRAVSAGTDIDAALKAANAQDLFYENIEKIRNSLQSIVEGPAMKLARGLAEMAGSGEGLYRTMGGIAIILTGMKLGGLIASFVSMATAATLTAAASAAVASAITLGVGLVAVVAGMYMIMNGMSSASDKAQADLEKKTQKKRLGGSVSGFGTGDTIPALLEPKEYVIPNSPGKTGTEKYHEMVNSNKTNTFSLFNFQNDTPKSDAGVVPLINGLQNNIKSLIQIQTDFLKELKLILTPTTKIPTKETPIKNETLSLIPLFTNFLKELKLILTPTTKIPIKEIIPNIENNSIESKQTNIDKNVVKPIGDNTTTPKQNDIDQNVNKSTTFSLFNFQNDTSKSDTGVIQAINGLRSDLKALASRPIHTSVQLDGKELATMQGKYPNEAGDANGQVAYQMS
jgi:hypothetical protein